MTRAELEEVEHIRNAEYQGNGIMVYSKTDEREVEFTMMDLRDTLIGYIDGLNEYIQMLEGQDD